MPGLACVRQLAGARAPALGVHRDHAAAAEDRLGRDERLLVARAAAHREDAALQVDPARQGAEQLRLRHEANLAADEDAEQEVVHVGEVVGREDRRAGLGHVLRADRPGAQQRPRVERAEDPHELVDEARAARARPRVEAVEVLLRARVGVDLRLQAGELLAHCEGAYRAGAPVGGGSYCPARWPSVAAHITGVVWKIECAVGDEVAEGDTVVVLESMKMEMPVEAEEAGTVDEIRCAEGQAVHEGDTLVVLG